MDLLKRDAFMNLGNIKRNENALQQGVEQYAASLHAHGTFYYLD